MKFTITLAVLIISVTTAAAQITPTYDEFRSLYRANFDVFRKIVSERGFEQDNKVKFTNYKFKEVINKEQSELSFFTLSSTKQTQVLNSILKNGYKMNTGYNGYGNPFKGQGDLIQSTFYSNNNSGMILIGQLKTYGDNLNQYFICFWNL